MSEFRQAMVYAIESSAPINLGAGVGTDRIRKAFARIETPVPLHVTVEVGKAAYEGLAMALISGHTAEVPCDPANILAMEIDRGARGQGRAQEAIAATRSKTIAGRQQEPDRRQPGT